MAKLISALFLLAGLAIVLAPAANAIGISPSSTYVENVLRGGYARVSFLVSNTEPTASNITLKLEGAAANWVSAPDVIVVPGRSAQSVDVLFQPASDAGNGIYEASLIAETESPAFLVGGSQATVKTSVTSRMFIQVVDTEKRELVVDSFEAPSAEAGQPAFVNIVASNKGNILQKFSVTLIVTDGNGKQVKNFEKTGFEVKATESTSLKIQYATDDLKPGQYFVEAAIAPEGLPAFSKTTGQRVYAPGEISRQGKVLEVQAPSWVKPGEIVKISVRFRNTGEVYSNAEVVGEVSLENEGLQEILSSKQFSIAPGEEVWLNAFYKPSKPGKYTAKVSILFGGKQIEAGELIINVNGESTVGSSSTAYLLLAILALIIFAAYVLRKKLPKIKIKA